MGSALIEQCAGWILDVIEEAGGPVRPKDVVDLARKEGFSRWTVYTARNYLGDRIVDTVGKGHPTNRWAARA